MDFRKIELIFLIAFLGVNLFLFRSYQQGIAETAKVNPANTSETLETRMQKDNIDVEVKTPFSKKVRQGYYLGAQETKFNSEIVPESITYRLNKGNQLTVYLDENAFSLFVNNSAQNFLNLYLKDGGEMVYHDEYTYSPELSKENKAAYYVQEWQDNIFMDDSAQVRVIENNKDNFSHSSFYYEQTHLENIAPLRESQNLCSIYDAINTLYTNNKIPAESTLKWVKLGYTRLFKVNETTVFIPVWFVGIEVTKGNTQIEKVNALNKTIVTNSGSDIKTGQSN